MQIIETSLIFNRPLARRRTTKRIVLHHTVSGDVSAATVHGWHLRNRGWGGIGYHYLVRTNGDIERGRPENTRGVHAPTANADSIAIVLAGNFSQTRPTLRQIVALTWLIRDIRGRHPHWEDLPVVGHKDVGATECPGTLFPWDTLQGRLREA